MKGEATTLFDFERDTPQDTIERVQEIGQNALAEQGVGLDV